MVNGLIIDKLLTVDDTGMPKAPTLRQLQDKDVLNKLSNADKCSEIINIVKEKESK